MGRRRKREALALLATLLGAATFINSYGRCLVPEGTTSDGHSFYDESPLEDLFKKSDAAIVARVARIFQYRNHGCRLNLSGNYIHRVTPPGWVSEIVLEVEEVYFQAPSERLHAAYEDLRLPLIKTGAHFRIAMYGQASKSSVEGRTDFPSYLNHESIKRGERRVFFLAFTGLLLETQTRSNVWTGGRSWSWPVTQDEVAYPPTSEMMRSLREDGFPRIQRIQINADTTGVRLPDLEETLVRLRT